MTYDEFKVQLIDKVKEKLAGSDVEIKVVSTTKNNQVEKEALVCDEEGTRVSPVIYLEEIYKEYSVAGDMESTVEKVLQQINDKPEIEPKTLIGSWDNVQYRVGARLVNYEWNKETLKDIPHKRILDLAVIPFVNVELESIESSGTIVIKNQFLEMWGIEAWELWEAVGIWLRREEFEYINVAQLLQEMMHEEMELPEDECPMYVLGNQSRCNGAVAILNTELLNRFAEEINECFYVLPSSVHECLLIPEHNVPDSNFIKEMIYMVNTHEVKEEERLSYNLYYYDTLAKELKIA